MIQKKIVQIGFGLVQHPAHKPWLQWGFEEKQKICIIQTDVL